MDATLVTAHSDKQGASATWKMGYGFHPLGAWAANTRECLAMLLRPGSAGSNTFTDHKEVLAAALQQVPAVFRRRVMVRIDGAGASHKLYVWFTTHHNGVVSRFQDYMNPLASSA
jgi:Transposase DDE domain group 1